jgi:putative two-component system response regulator
MVGLGARDSVGDRFFALSQDLMCIADRDRRIVAANPAFQTVLGWRAEDLVGISFADFIHPDEVAAIDFAQMEALEGNSLVDFVNRFRKSDGSYLWILWTASTDRARDLTYAVGKDVTERKQTMLASIVNHSADAIVGKDLDLKITAWNAGAERMYGYTAAEIIGQRIGMLIPPERDGEDGAIISRVLAGETVDHFETVRLHRDGRKLDVSVSVSAIRDPSGQIIGASSIARDIGETRALVKAQNQVIKRLLLAAEFRDDAPGQHLVRMSSLCGQIAVVLGWNRKRVAEIESAATMHDVGKIAVPDSILLKPGPLTGEERAVMQTHAQVGQRILSGTGIDLVDQAAEIAFTHHERFDGGGYPSGLSGEAIPICGRIAAAADVFDALTSDRVYRPAFTDDQALAMMRGESGTQFDSKILAALLEVLDTERQLIAPRAALDPGQAAAGRDLAAAGRDLAAAGRDLAAAGRDQSQADADQRSSSRDQAAAGRARAAADRDRAAADRDQFSYPQLRPKVEAEQRSFRRDQAAADRDHSAADRDRAAADRGLSKVDAEQRSSDRDDAASEREHAVADRDEAAADRVIVARDRERARVELRRAQIDQLTGALGRELGMVALDREINRAQRGDGRLVLAYVDVNGLKEVNDREGHAAGDQLLRDVVGAIRAHLRAYDPVVRVGGDEFVCALGDSVSEDARPRFQAIAATIEQTRQGASISVGFAELRPGDTLAHLTERGDAALYEAKHGR